MQTTLSTHWIIVTASFSDIANAVSTEHQFWLGDAFASGGLNGYDHKAPGITLAELGSACDGIFKNWAKTYKKKPLM